MRGRVVAEGVGGAPLGGDVGGGLGIGDGDDGDGGGGGVGQRHDSAVDIAVGVVGARLVGNASGKLHGDSGGDSREEEGGEGQSEHLESAREKNALISDIADAAASVSVTA